ncbi:MAG TPA: glutathione S-transferase family protein [Caulobacteraceae bacterium]|nr:glutathione S-transferase family protein [Caulobacteraceae bacterium]
MELVIGDYNWSTWSLRPWLVLKRCGAPFTERLIHLNREDTHENILKHSPSGLVPALKVEGEVIWDSMAISVWAAEHYPEAGLWPVGAHERWLARSATCEMHAGFAALRKQCPMDLKLRTTLEPSEETAADLRRLVGLWREMRERFGQDGPYLFGAWSMPDAFFTPVATRVRSYGLDLSAHGDEDGVAQAYVDALLEQPDFLEWERRALA